MKPILTKTLSALIFATAISISGCSQAQEAAPLSAQVSAKVKQDKAQTGNWAVIAAESHVKFTAKQQGNGFTGQFNEFEADINFDPANIGAASVTAAIDIASIMAGDKDRDGALPGKEWFFTKKFPKAVFQSNDFTQTGPESYAAAGTLSIKGTDHPLTLPFTLTVKDGTADMSGQVTIDRTLWELGSGVWSTDEWVSTAVDIDIKIKAEAR